MFGRKFARQVPEWQRAFASVSVQRRQVAARELMEACYAEKNPSPALPLIESMLRDPDESIGHYATVSASKCGAPVLPVLARLAKDADALVRERACCVIGHLEADSTRSLHAEIITALSDTAPGVRTQAAFALGRMADGSRVTIDALAAAIGDQVPKVRMWVLSALGRFGRENGSRASVKAHLPAVLSSLADADADVRQTALSTLENLELPAERLLPAVLDLLQTEKTVEVLSVVRRLFSQLGNRCDLAEHLPAMLAVAARNPAGSAAIFAVCGDLGSRAQSALPHLESAVASDDRCSYEAVFALWQIAGRAEKCMPPLERLLEREWFDASRALDLLAKMTDARPYVIPMLRHALPHSPDEAAGMIFKLGAEAAPLLPDLVRVVEDNWDEPDWDLMWALTDALNAIESSEPLAVATLAKLLTHPSPRIRYLAVKGLERAGPGARAAVGALWKAGEDEDREIAKAARAVLRIIGEPN